MTGWPDIGLIWLGGVCVDRQSGIWYVVAVDK